MNKQSNSGRILALIFVAAAASSCGVLSDNSSLKVDAAAPYTGSIRVNLKHPANQALNDYSLLFAANQNVVSLGVCVTKKTPTCTVGATGYFAANLIYNDGKKNFFMPKSSAILEDGLVLTVVGSDKAGAVVDTRNVKFTGSTPAASTATTPAATTATVPATTTTTPAATTTTPAATNTTPTGADTGANQGGGSSGAGNFGGSGGGW